MNIGLITCSILGLFLFILSLIFLILKQKAAMLISGFNTMSKDKRALYNSKALALDTGYSFLKQVVIVLIGAILCWLISIYIVVPTIIIWLIVFFKGVHLDEDKAFEKYKL